MWWMGGVVAGSWGTAWEVRWPAPDGASLEELLGVVAPEAHDHAVTAPYRDVVRAKIVLMAADGLQNKEMAHRLSLPVQVVTRWRKRF